MTKLNEQEWITTAQAAAILGLSTRQVKNLIPERFPNARKLSGLTTTYLLLRSEVQQELKRRQAK